MRQIVHCMQDDLPPFPEGEVNVDAIELWKGQVFESGYWFNKPFLIFADDATFSRFMQSVLYHGIVQIELYKNPFKDFKLEWVGIEACGIEIHVYCNP